MEYIESILRKPVTWFCLGVATSLTLGFILYGSDGHSHDAKHPIGYANNSDEVHVHSDWLVYLAGEYYDFTDDKYQTTAMQTLHPDIHIHDHDDDVIHRHEHDITLAAFLDSLGFALTNHCIATDKGTTFCNNDSNDLLVYVNGALIPEPESYVPNEEDRVLFYYGNPADTERITALQNEITDRSCYYSGTCPEQGTPPPEACGLTCEL